MDKALVFELERTLERRFDSKLISYQVKHSQGFYERITALYGGTFNLDFVQEHRPFFAHVTQYCLYDTLDIVTKATIEKQLGELEVLLDLSDNPEDFTTFFEKKYGERLPHFSQDLVPQEKRLSDFDEKLLIALNYNPKD